MATFNDEVGAEPCVVVEVSPDIHICGFCKQQYYNFEGFLAHKRSGCSFSSPNPAGSSTTPTLTDPSTELVLEENYQTCAVRGVQKSLTKTPKTPSNKLKPVLTSKKHSCCFSGCSFKTQYGQKDMERHLKTHTGMMRSQSGDQWSWRTTSCRLYRFLCSNTPDLNKWFLQNLKTC